jgi:hypothetical protein
LREGLEYLGLLRKRNPICSVTCFHAHARRLVGLDDPRSQRHLSRSVNLTALRED